VPILHAAGESTGGVSFSSPGWSPTRINKPVKTATSRYGERLDVRAHSREAAGAPESAKG
jgi:hypothetical protein